MSELDAKNQRMRITVPPGTPEYRRQFDRQALAAADRALRMGVVRFICACLGLMFAWMFVGDVFRHDWSAIVCVLPAAELLFVAVLGKSMYLRFLLSGIRPQHTENNDQPQSPADTGSASERERRERE